MRLYKRLFDLLLCMAFSPILILLLAGTAILVAITLGRPIMFSQQRQGLHGKSFTLYKFRTMSDKRDSKCEMLPDVQRLGEWGIWLRKLSLDELPTIYNVLRGEMSLVGPRPLLEEYLILYSATQARRHEVAPGVTGWAQVNGRNAISWEQKFEYDVWYVDHGSFGFDLKILVLSVLSVLKREGISQQGHATMEKFSGTDNK